MLGAVVSSIVNVADVVVALPQSSVAVNVTIALPVAPQSSLNESKSWLHETVPQRSLAEAPPWASNQAFNASLLPAPSHSTVSSEAATSMLGAVVSMTMMVWVTLAATLPASSVAVNVRTMV
jgi:hypothetical protein